MSASARGILPYPIGGARPGGSAGPRIWGGLPSERKRPSYR